MNRLIHRWMNIRIYEVYMYIHIYIDILHIHGMYMAYTHMYICIHKCVCV